MQNYSKSIASNKVIAFMCKICQESSPESDIDSLRAY